MPYTPNNWYWYVGGDTSKAYSSAVGDYVPATDLTFQAWLATNAPSSIASEIELGAVLAQILARPANAVLLDAYQGAHADNIVAQIIFKILFNHDNRIRALEGKQAVTVAQARAAIKALM